MTNEASLPVANSVETSALVSGGSSQRRHSRRILFTCWDFRLGGVCSYTLILGRALRRRGHLVGALVPEPFGELHGDFRESLDYVDIVRRGVQTRKAYLHRLLDRIKIFKPDVLINSAVPMVQAVMPSLPQHVLRLSTVHSIMQHEPGIALANASWVDCVVAVSDSVRELLNRQNGGRVKLATIPVSVEQPPTRRPRDQAARPLRLIYVGRISPEKNLPGLLRVLGALHSGFVPFSMTVVGDGPDLASVRAEATNSSFATEVTFLGPRAPREVSRLSNR